jgi:glycosyltransferase involved in cell wall biosynthesis
MHNPQVSVVMPVFNRQQYVGAAIESILAQTITDFELIIVDDGSTDQSMAVIQGYRDPRIRLIHFSQNKGVSAARNIGNEVARGTYIAVMDSDDIALPRRLEKQLAFMRTHPDVDICGATVRWVNDAMHHTEDGPAVTGSKRCLAKLVLELPFSHPTLFVRRSIYQHVQYESQWEPMADYRFLTEVSLRANMDAIRDVVLLMRSHPQRMSVVMMEKQDDLGGEISALYLERMGLALDERQKTLWKKFRRPRDQLLDHEELMEMSQLSGRLMEANTQTKMASQRYLHVVLARKWWHILRVSPHLRGLATFRIYFQSPLKRRGPLQPIYDLRMLTLCLGLGRGIRIVQWLARLKMRLLFLRS